MWGSSRDAKWTRLFSTVVFLVGGALLVFLFMVSEHGTSILPAARRIARLGTAIYGGVAVLVAWLPATGRIKA